MFCVFWRESIWIICSHSMRCQVNQFWFSIWIFLLIELYFWLPVFLWGSYFLKLNIEIHSYQQFVVAALSSCLIDPFIFRWSYLVSGDGEQALDGCVGTSWTVVMENLLLSSGGSFDFGIWCCRLWHYLRRRCSQFLFDWSVYFSVVLSSVRRWRMVVEGFWNALCGRREAWNTGW